MSYMDWDFLKDECDKTRKRVSGYSKEKKAELLEQARTTMSKLLTFAEVEEGDTFISFPIDGDDSGHGGFRKGGWLFRKLRHCDGKDGENAVRCGDGVLTKWSPNSEVYLVS